MRHPPFPDGFVWGTATAAHQVEGGNWNNDWWAWEHDPASPCVEPSADACDAWHRYPDDLRLLGGLGFGSYRFSVEWSRIEPEDGEWSRVALDHYRRLCATCLEHGLDPVVTFHHFTTPRWLAARGGWSDPATADRFARFCETATRAFGDLMTRACTLNEPNIVATMGYLAGVFPPGAKDPDLRRRANDTFVDAHGKAVEAIKGVVDVPVGLTLAMADHQAVGGPEAEQRRARILRNFEDVYLEAVRGDDFLGVQTYSRVRIGPEGELGPEDGVETTIMGYEFWPEALEATLRRAWDETAHVPLLVTENGIATDDDTRRVEYVARALAGVLRCLDDGVDVRGYTYWSALDNFEWALGYGPTFGLIAVDRATQERVVRPSARWLGECARANALVEPASLPSTAGR
ncbi:MAG TPA: family 1 glycosylhydrolase [Acidimicrobiales bacterium]|jgi:beta-glucosidase